MFKIKAILITTVFISGFQWGKGATVKEVEDLVNSAQYNTAYQRLNEVVENTPEVFYLKGLCMYYLNTDLDEAVVLLTKALTAGGPDRIRLVLGMIYHKQYRFSDAQRLLKEYLTLAKTQEDKDITLLYIKFCQHANAVTHRGKQIQITGKTELDKNDIAVKYNEEEINGIVVPKPFNLNSKNDEKNNGLNKLMVLPKDAEKIKYVYYSAYEAGRPDHSDIYRVEVLESGEFSVPDNLGSVINTSQDEMFPCFDEKDQVLYFASKGHQSIGGYDIFMSYYNAGAESWSKPINMGIPFNSTADDYFIMPMDRENEFLFTTKRESSFDNVHVMKTFVPPGAAYKTLLNRDDIISFNHLNIGKAVSGEISSGNTSSKIEDEKYKKLVEEALNYQVKADSVKRKMHEQEQKISVALGESRKLQLASDLKIMQEEHRILKEQADIHYDAVKEWERQNGITTSQLSIPDKNVETPLDNDIVVQEFKVEETKVEPVVKEAIKPTESKNVIQPDNNNETYEAPRNLVSNFDLPDGIVFSVQIGVFSKKIDKTNFQGMKDIFYYFISGRNLYKYYTGVFNNIDEARDYLVTVKQKGYSDAFLVAFEHKEPVSIESALGK